MIIVMCACRQAFVVVANPKYGMLRTTYNNNSQLLYVDDHPQN